MCVVASQSQTSPGLPAPDANHIDLTLLVGEEAVVDDDLALDDVAQVGPDQAFTDLDAHPPPVLAAGCHLARCDSYRQVEATGPPTRPRP